MRGRPITALSLFRMATASSPLLGRRYSVAASTCSADSPGGAIPVATPRASRTIVAGSVVTPASRVPAPSLSIRKGALTPHDASARLASYSIHRRPRPRSTRASSRAPRVRRAARATPARSSGTAHNRPEKSSTVACAPSSGTVTSAPSSLGSENETACPNVEALSSPECIRPLLVRHGVGGGR